MTLRAALGLVLGAVTVFGTSTWAAAPPAAEAPVKAPSPWEKGVSEAAKKRATALFDKANALFVQKDYGKAIAAYQKALKEWEHPSIGFNLAESLIEVGRYLEARAVLDRALRFGQGPLAKASYATALRYQKLVRRSLAKVRVRCDEPGAVVTFDGKPLLTGPATKELEVPPGTYVAVAKKAGFKVTTRNIVAGAGVTTQASIQLDPIMEVRDVYPLPEALPWAVLGTGLALTAVGVPLWVVSNDRADEADQVFSQSCNQPNGCAVSEVADVLALRDEAEGMRSASIAMFAIGGAATLAGVILAVMNRPEQVEVPVVVPVAGPRSAGVWVRF